MSTDADTFAAEAARRLRRLPPRGATTVLVGPPLVYDEDTLSLVVVRGIPGGRHRTAAVDLGRHVPDALDHPLAHLFDVVAQARRVGEVTMREGRARKAALVRELGRGGARVVDCATEADLVERYGRLFPGRAGARAAGRVRRRGPPRRLMPARPHPSRTTAPHPRDERRRHR